MITDELSNTACRTPLRSLGAELDGAKKAPSPQHSMENADHQHGECYIHSIYFLADFGHFSKIKMTSPGVNEVKLHSIPNETKRPLPLSQSRVKFAYLAQIVMLKQLANSGNKPITSAFINPRTDGGLGQLRTDGGGRMTAPPGYLKN